MINPVSSSTPAQAQTAVQSTAARQPASVSKSQLAVTSQPAATDTVKISAAAQALQEATETPAQTAKEAGTGDAQAKRLLAKEAIEHQ